MSTGASTTIVVYDRTVAGLGMPAVDGELIAFTTSPAGAWVEVVRVRRR